MKRDPIESPKERPSSESTPDPKGVEFVRGKDYDEWEDMLVKAAREVNEELRAKGLLPKQQKKPQE